MDKGEILRRAIQKATEGGWTPTPGLVTFEAYADSKYKSMKYIAYDDSRIQVALIFNHDFAKALWGSFNDDINPNMPRLSFQSSRNTLPDKWQYHLQQMVIADDPIAYLGEHLDG